MGKPPYFGPRASLHLALRTDAVTVQPLGPTWPCVCGWPFVWHWSRMPYHGTRGSSPRSRKAQNLLRQSLLRAFHLSIARSLLSFVNGRVTDVVPVGRALTRGASDAAEGRVKSIVRATLQEALQPRTDRASPTGRAAYTWCGQCGQARREPIGRAPTRGAGVAVAGRRRTGSSVAPLSCGAADGAERCSCQGILPEPGARKRAGRWREGRALSLLGKRSFGTSVRV